MAPSSGVIPAKAGIQLEQEKSMEVQLVIPAHAGIQPNARATNGRLWMPAYAGMTANKPNDLKARNISE